MGAGKSGYAGVKTVVISVLIGILVPHTNLSDAHYGDSGATIDKDAASVSSNSG